MLDEKDILVCVHIRNILRARGCYRHVKVPSSPYKRGRTGTCKRIQTFLELVLLAEGITVSLHSDLELERGNPQHVLTQNLLILKSAVHTPFHFDI
jgi:hypothetical protein